MKEIGWWMVLALVIALLAASEVRADMWSAWLRDRVDPWLHKFRHR